MRTHTKQFLTLLPAHRVRYFAMRLRRPQDSHAWQWFLRRLRVLRPLDPAPESASPLPESLLVALSAIQHYDPHWLEQAGLFSPEGDHPPSDAGDATPEVLRQTLQSHQGEFENWPPSDVQQQLFRKLSAGIRVH